MRLVTAVSLVLSGALTVAGAPPTAITMPTKSCLVVMQKCDTDKGTSDSLDVSATQTRPGHTESTHRTGKTGTVPPAPSRPVSEDAVPDLDLPDATAVDCVSPAIPCTTTPEPAETTQPDTVRRIPTVTISDLASFRPDTPSLASEPDQVGITGLPTNLVATTGTQTVHGMLLGFTVTVRFTPHHYTFTHGDGTTTTTRTPGTTWQTSGDVQFTPTATSHAYTDRGRYTATVTVAYTPAVDFGDGTWRTVAGYITATSPAQTIHVYEAHTALVAHTCTEDPHGKGC